MNLLRRTMDALRSAFTGKAGLLRVLAIAAVVLAMTAAAPNAAEACGISDPLSCVAMIFVKIFQLLTALMGFILVLEVEALIRVAQFFNFVSPGPAAVQLGWVVTRDLANMFFIVILLIIAFGTILGSSTYHYSKNLPRLLIMAVVINFSKTICGIFIDMGQVVMLTFVNGFKETAAGNFMNAYQINKLLALGNTEGSYTFGMVIAMMFAFILAAIAVCVTLVLLVIVLFRVVMLWILIILSPIAFLTSAIPRGGDYYAKWWSEFKKYIITGPIIAFFMWLALASVQQVGPGGFASQGFPATYAGAGEAAAAAGKESKIITEAGTADTIMNMVIAICIMFAGLKYASESGAVGSGFAGSMRKGLEKTGRNIAAYGVKRAAEPVMSTVGKGLAKVPLVGGLGRGMALQGEKWKKERQASREKFAGTPEDVARLSPGAYTRKMASLKDPKEIERWRKAGEGNPAIMAAMTKSTRSYSPLTGKTTVSSPAKTMMSNMLAAGKGEDVAKLAMSDKRYGDMLKGDPAMLKDVYGGMEKAVALNPNLKKDMTAFETKFAVPLTKNDVFSSLDSVKREKLASLAPKMSAEDIGGLDSDGVALLAEHMSSGQMKKIMQDGKPEQLNGVMEGLRGSGSWKTPLTMAEAMTQKGIKADDMPAAWLQNADVAAFALADSKNNTDARSRMMKDPAKAPLLQQAAKNELAKAQASGNDRKVAAAALQSLSVGSLTAEDIKGDVNLRSAIGKGMDASSFSRGVNKEDAGQMAAATEAFAAFKEFNPDKARNLSKHEQYQDFGLGTPAPAPAAAPAAAPAPLKLDESEVQKFADALGARAAQLSSSAASGGSNPFASRNQEELRKINEAVRDLNSAMTKYAEAQKSGDKATMDRLAEEIGKLRQGMKGTV